MYLKYCSFCFILKMKLTQMSSPIIDSLWGSKERATRTAVQLANHQGIFWPTKLPHPPSSPLFQPAQPNMIGHNHPCGEITVDDGERQYMFFFIYQKVNKLARNRVEILDILLIVLH